MIFLADLLPTETGGELFSLKFNLGNLITILTTILTGAGIYWKLRNRSDNNTDKIKELSENYEKLQKEGSSSLGSFREKIQAKIEDIDRNGSLKFQNFKESYERLISANDEKFKKLDELDKKVEKMSVQVELIAKWVEKQQN